MQAEPRSLAGKTVLVTGAAGSIGRAITEAFVAEGSRVVATDIDAGRLDALKNDLPDVVAVRVDLSTASGVDQVMQAAGGEVDVVSINAGVSDGGAALDEITDETWERVIGIHLHSAFLLSRRAIGPMLRKKAGVFLFMSSVAGLRGGRTGIAYTSAKWALVGMAQNIAASLGPEGIRAYAICPGNITGATTAAGVTFTPRALANRGRDRLRPPPGKATDVADLAVFLAGDGARHINGVAIPVDGGTLAF